MWESRKAFPSLCGNPLVRISTETAFPQAFSFFFGSFFFLGVSGQKNSASGCPISCDLDRVQVIACLGRGPLEADRPCPMESSSGDFLEFYLHSLPKEEGIKGIELGPEFGFGVWGDVGRLDEALIRGFGTVVMFDGF